MLPYSPPGSAYTDAAYVHPGTELGKQKQASCDINIYTLDVYTSLTWYSYKNAQDHLQFLRKCVQILSQKAVEIQISEKDSLLVFVVY